MNKYKLFPKPNNLHDHCWECSTYKDEIIVVARNPEDARSICDDVTWIGAEAKGPTKHSPWLQGNLVECEVLEENVETSRGVLSPPHLKIKWGRLA